MTESPKDIHSARLERFVLHKIKSLKLIQYLSTGKYPKDLTRRTEGTSGTTPEHILGMHKVNYFSYFICCGKGVHMD